MLFEIKFLCFVITNIKKLLLFCKLRKFNKKFLNLSKLEFSNLILRRTQSIILSVQRIIKINTQLKKFEKRVQFVAALKIVIPPIIAIPNVKNPRVAQN